ncbi:hypothetical protein G7Z17_g11031 [Cylindrodendrum hubeiense]|uniref:Beta-lactamase-related domain-containing protein n=1 Tax=Cylindrodendrum hubeiense TaxID=595255 RepID=A0A9P5LAM7_9HYPO|nr:hypothetical protein G7Z17_g11031 [Cylindrodendrum hubeiense]
MPSLSKLAVLAVGAFALVDAKTCPPMGAVFPAPQAPSQNKGVKSAASALKDALDEQMGSLFETSAVSIGVKSIHEDEPLFTYHFTPPNPGSGAQKIGDNTMYRIASVSKLFTVLAALQNTNIDMNASVLKYLPHLNETATGDSILSLDWEDITVASLTGHLSGLGVDLAQDLGVVGSEAWVKMGLPEFAAKSGPTCSGLPGTIPCTKEDLLDQVNRRPPIYAPYTNPVYSNIGIAMLGLVVEAATNKTFHEVVTRDILDAVGMKHTSTGEVPSAKDIFIPEGDTIWNSTLEVFDAAGGMYSSLGDLQAFGEAILTNKLLSPMETRRWMKPASTTSSWGYMVGHPWEILRSDNITSDGRLIDVYTKSGDLGLYHALTGLVPDYDLVITVMMAGAEASARYAPSIAFSAVIKSLLPAIEAAGREQAKTSYVGEYTEQSTNSSITFKTDGGPGLVISEWTVRGFDVLKNIGGYSWATLETGKVGSPPPVAARVYPTNLQGDDKAAWRAVFDFTNSTVDDALDNKLFFKDGSCQTWFSQDRQTYDFLSLDEFVFVQSEGEAKTVKNPAFNITLTKVHPAPEKKTNAAGTATGAPGALGAALAASLVLRPPGTTRDHLPCINSARGTAAITSESAGDRDGLARGDIPSSTPRATHNVDGRPGHSGEWLWLRPPVTCSRMQQEEGAVLPVQVFTTLPLRVRDRDVRHNDMRHSDPGLCKFPTLGMRTDARPKRVPESLHFAPGAFRLRSPTESSMSSISSANVPDSATTHSLSTLASPISTSYASDVQELFASTSIGSRPTSRICHRHQPSNGTCSTFVNDEDDGPIITGYPDFELKLRQLREDHRPTAIVGESQPVSPATESPVIKDEDTRTECESVDIADTDADADADLDFDADADGECDANTQKWEGSSTTSEDLSRDDSNMLLGYALQLVYGIDINEASISSATAQGLVANFVQDIDKHIWKAPSDTQLSHTMSTSSSSSTPSQEGLGGNHGRGGKRKKLGKREDDGDEFSDGEGSGFLPTKRVRPNPREDDNLRLSCPFRKRNPHRFNVRDHHSCAMTYFPKFAELRQHIVKQHKRDDPTAFVCDRCTRDFPTGKELRDHRRLPKEQICDIKDNDVESGIDSTTATKLLSRKRASGASTLIQWREIWNILFPDDEDREIKPYDFTPVIEHFELSSNYLVGFEQLQLSLRDKISNPATLETLSTKFHQCFVETLEKCIADAQSMPYTNRSNKKSEIVKTQAPQTIVQRKSRGIQPRPDSGVVMDDGSEESGSIMGAGIGLGPRDSIRTVKGAQRRGSSLARETVHEVLPATSMPGNFDEPLMRTQQPAMTPLGMATPASMDPAAVQAWNNSVIYPPLDDGTMALPDQFVQSGGLAPQTEYMSWMPQMYQQAFGNIDNGFTGFNGQ